VPVEVNIPVEILELQHPNTTIETTSTHNGIDIIHNIKDGRRVQCKNEHGRLSFHP
jgi:hypothetical protein